MENIKKILVAIDRSAMAEEALKRAISIAKGKSAQLIVIHVIEPYFIESPFISSVQAQLLLPLYLHHKKQKQTYSLSVRMGKMILKVTILALPR